MRLQAVRLGAGRPAALGYLLAAGICVLGLAIARAIEPCAVHGIPTRVYIPIHNVLEFTSIVVSFAVFAIGWYGYRQTTNRRDLFIAVGYMAVGAIDFVHTLSYTGMPDFLGANSVGKAAAYWLSARLVDAVLLLGAAFVTPVSRSRWIRPGILVPAAAAICLSLVSLVSIYGKAASELMYRPGTGLTPLKIDLEWFVIVLYVAAFWAFGRARGWQKDSVRLLQAALIFGVASEICFTLYRTAYDAYNLLGHIYKVGAYYLVLQALFVSSLSRPYRELSQAKQQLQKSLTRIGEALASGLHKNPTLKLIASLARQMFDAEFAAIGEVKEGGVIEVATYDGADPGVIRVPVRNAIAGETFLTGRPLLVEDVRLHPKVRPEWIKLGVRSLMAAAIVTDGRPAGALYVGSFEVAGFTPEDAEVLTAFARQAAVALANAEYYEREHHIAESLQQVIFPPPRSRVGEFEIAGKYEPAWDEARVGGDFYDYFDLGDGRLGIAIGDVSGKGLHAAVHTAVVKYSYQAYVRQGLALPEALLRLSQALEEHTLRSEAPTSIFVSLFCAVLDLETGRLVYSNAGHEPPVKVSAAGEAVALDSTGPILGLGSGAPIEQSETTLRPGDLLVLYTDGITEARADGRLFGYEGLLDVVRSFRECSPEDLAERLYERAKTHARGTLQDDVALMVVRRDTEE